VFRDHNPAAVGWRESQRIKDKGSISGFYIDGAGKNHGFRYAKGDPDSRFQRVNAQQVFG